jgi:ADP-ribose pyrophosphatase YjhB (NUDIX family)
MDYVGDLRKSIGHKPLLMVGATVLCLNKQNELLMIRRAESGNWGVPGGAMELGETIEETGRRELLEETNLEAGGMELFGVFSGPELYYRYANGDEVYNVSVVYLTKATHGEVELRDGEHIGFGYFPLHNLPERLSPPIRPILKELVERFSVPTCKRSNGEQAS